MVVYRDDVAVKVQEADNARIASPPRFEVPMSPCTASPNMGGCHSRSSGSRAKHRLSRRHASPEPIGSFPTFATLALQAVETPLRQTH